MTRRIAMVPTALVAAAAALVAVPVEGATACVDLAKLSIPSVTIDSAQLIAAGAFTPPATPGRGNAPAEEGRGAAGGRGAATGRGAAGGRGAGTGRGAAAGQPAAAGRGGGAGAQAYAGLPAFCRVAATVKPSTDSDIKIEVWLPESGWNGKFQGVGNGGWAGTIGYSALATALSAGYATASTDTGHTGNNAAFALGHPEKLMDMGYRAIHEMTVQGKAITDAYFGSVPKLSFFNGCSLGGRQAITEAERYPADYNGILAGASAVYNMQIHVARVALNALSHRASGTYIPPEKYEAIHKAVLDACDANDGVKDGVLEDPLRCQFNPAVLECKGPDGPWCLTNAQVETMRLMYSPMKVAKGGTIPALLQPGSELGWGTLAGPEPVGTALTAMQYIVFKDPNWDVKKFNPGTDFDLALQADSKNVLSLTDPNLKPFFDRGGKLLMYHGWQDPQVPAQNSVKYFGDVLKTTGKAMAGSSIQLYMVPGMNHCQGGPGTDTFDKMGAIESWVASGKAPAQIVASHLTDGKVDKTRPLCPLGQVAKWNGSGSTDDAANFACVAQAADTRSR